MKSKDTKLKKSLNFSKQYEDGKFKQIHADDTNKWHGIRIEYKKYIFKNIVFLYEEHLKNLIPVAAIA